MNYDLAPERWKTIPPDHVARMQISGDIRKAVVFVGYGTGDNPAFVGTGFVQLCRGFSWLVTAAHVANDLGADPFYMRANVGKPEHIDDVVWTPHPDKNVDIAVTPLALKSKSIEVGYVPEDALLTLEQRPFYKLDLGNFVYVIGLFRLLPGRRRNLPVVHTGHIATLPEGDTIPVQFKNGDEIDAAGYLVQVPSMPGLSGAPVFARRTRYLESDEDGTTVAAGAVALMGVWIASWPGKAAPELEVPGNATVPVGFGVVIPAERIAETVDEHMSKYKEFTGAGERAAVAESAPPTTATNPDHREDFNRLVDAAMSGNKQGSETS